jgi:hypothetical protein
MGLEILFGNIRADTDVATLWPSADDFAIGQITGTGTNDSANNGKIGEIL